MTQDGGENMYWITGFMGLILALTPFIFGYYTQPAALWISLIVGGVLLISSGVEWFAEDKQTWEYWVAGLAGLTALVAPFALGFYGLTAALWSMVIAGVVAVIASGARLTMGKSDSLRY